MFRLNNNTQRTQSLGNFSSNENTNANVIASCLINGLRTNEENKEEQNTKHTNYGNVIKEFTQKFTKSGEEEQTKVNNDKINEAIDNSRKEFSNLFTRMYFVPFSQSEDSEDSEDSEESEDSSEDSEETEEEELQDLPDLVEPKKESVMSKYYNTAVVNGKEVVDPTVSGAYFNSIHRGVQFVKLTNESCCHNGFQFKEGLNCDTNKFDAFTSCGGDGIYFCKRTDAINWFDYGHSKMVYLWDVIIPEDAKVCMYENKMKADKIIIVNKRPLGSVAGEQVRSLLSTGASTEGIFNTIRRNYGQDLSQDKDFMSSLKFMLGFRPSAFSMFDDKYKTHEICALAAKYYEDAYIFIPPRHRTQEILMSCLSRNARIFQNFDKFDKSEQICSIALFLNIQNYEYIPEDFKTLENSRTYLSGNQSGNHYVRKCQLIPKEFRNQLVDLVIKHDPKSVSVQTIDYKLLSEERCSSIVSSDGQLLKNIPLFKITEDICMKAVKSPLAIDYVPHNLRTREVLEAYIEHNPLFLHKLKETEITYDMLANSVLISENVLGNFNLNIESSPLRIIVKDNIKKLIEINPSVINHIPKCLLTSEDVLAAVTMRPALYRIVQKWGFADDEFKIKVVKSGVNFSAIPHSLITIELVKELVESRSSLIDELPKQYLSDDLFITAIETHDYDYTLISDEFMTEKLNQYIANKFPESKNALEFAMASCFASFE